LRDLLSSLGRRLRQEFPSLADEEADDQVSAWYALSGLTAGYAAFTRMSIRVPIQDGQARNWSDERVKENKQVLERIEREVRLIASREAAMRSPADPFREEPGVTEDPVIGISFIETPADEPT
jgi:hypothetical protein